jgi:excisionase family DNA binding protein
VTDASEAEAVLGYVGRLLADTRRRARANGGWWPVEMESAWALASGRQEPPEIDPTTGLGEPLLVTYAHAGKLLSVSKRSVERLVAHGELPVVQVGAARRIRTGDLVTFVSSARRQPGEAPRPVRSGDRAGRRNPAPVVDDGPTAA